jgi:hypothetical protein
MYPMFIDELMHISLKEGKSRYGFLVALSFFKTDFPWIYDTGKELIDVIKSEISKEAKMEAVDEFKSMLEFTFHHPMMREMYGRRKEYHIYMKEMPYMLLRYIEEVIMNSK